MPLRAPQFLSHCNPLLLSAHPPLPKEHQNVKYPNTHTLIYGLSNYSLQEAVKTNEQGKGASWEWDKCPFYGARSWTCVFAVLMYSLPYIYMTNVGLLLYRYRAWRFIITFRGFQDSTPYLCLSSMIKIQQESMKTIVIYTEHLKHDWQNTTIQ